MQKLYQQARQIATSNATILILGETGTGKEMLARAIHLCSNRKDKMFVAINCVAVPSNLLESELFGHVKGAFTGAIASRIGLIEKAEGGTLFLDEIGDLPLELQPKLLRVLQEREIQQLGSNDIKKVKVRVIGATHRSLLQMVQENAFREDLFYRLSVIPVTIPPVRERKEDIVLLFKHFLQEAARAEQKNLPSIQNDVIQKFESYQWPGNVREIQNVAQRLMVLNTTGTIELDDLPELIYNIKDNSISFENLPKGGLDLEELIDKIVVSALNKNNWNQSKTAKYLNISRNTLIYRIDKRPLLIQERMKQDKNE